METTIEILGLYCRAYLELDLRLRSLLQSFFARVISSGTVV